MIKQKWWLFLEYRASPQKELKSSVSPVLDMLICLLESAFPWAPRRGSHTYQVTTLCYSPR